MLRYCVYLAAVVLVVATAVACAKNLNETPGGVVQYHNRRSVTVLQDDGKTVVHRTGKFKARSCTRGERWPAC